uniref:ABC-2 type transporter transmembrane domain-containing protein n=1 Tax=Plectus sambesii TaxID=2011161 RepID=A0A914UTX1_9BILA
MDTFGGLSIDHTCRFGAIVALNQLCETVKWYEFKVKGFASEDDLVRDTMDLSTSNRFIGAVIFDDIETRHQWSYTLRFRYYLRNLLPEYFTSSLAYNWQTSTVVPGGIRSAALPYPNLADGGLPAYWRELFLSLQAAVDWTLTEMMGETEHNNYLTRFNLVMQRFPYPAHHTNPLYSYASILLPICMTISFMISILYISKAISLDQENGIKEYLFVMGLKTWAYWLAHFILNAIKSLVAIALLSFVFCFLFPTTRFEIIIIFVLLYGLNALLFGFAVSAVFSQGSFTSLFAVIGWFLLYIPSLYFQNQEDTYNDKQKMASCALPSMASIKMIQILVTLEGQ